MTYSIVARDPETGELGVAVQTALVGVGRLCPWAEAGVGAVATQALVRVAHGPTGLNMMRNGFSAVDALIGTLAADDDSYLRQVGMIDVNGKVDAFTGTGTIRYAGHVVGENYAAQANMMATDTVPDAMAKAFEESAGKPLFMRMLAALHAAQNEGGDFRGTQSAALKVVSGTLTSAPWEGILYDVRVDDHVQPVAELERICNRMYAYKLADEASRLALSERNTDAAMEKIRLAEEFSGGDPQVMFWFTVNMADNGHFELVEPVLSDLMRSETWAECLIRYDEARPLKTDDIVQKILSLRPD